MTLPATLYYGTETIPKKSQNNICKLFNSAKFPHDATKNVLIENSFCNIPSRACVLFSVNHINDSQPNN